ncbi:MAG TPA: FAD:protein FMN transferase [Mycobacteriales bacterium]|nr:FAD:protein FMN transferase [Mycobacteriales bacterium]
MTRYVHRETVMGTVFSFDIRADIDPAAAIEEAVAFLHHVDTVFSTYREDSDIRRLDRGECRMQDCSPAVAEVLRMCATATGHTDGYFSALHSGHIDPTGLVKGWSIDTASAILSTRGMAVHSINGGGDIRAMGFPSPEMPWRVGISDPRRPRELIAAVTGTDFAVATSGPGERGPHIVDPVRGRVARSVLSATVTGPQLAWADAYATALVACGVEAMQWIEALPGYEAIVLTAAGAMHRTAQFPDLNVATTTSGGQ